MITGAEYVASFLAKAGCRHVFTLNGGACAFLVDAVGRHPALALVPVQNEQAAAMAADAVWRVSRRVGVTMATSGPGATNLVTGIACSFFDSIPSLHVTGQVNQRESRALHGAKVRQAGFQETKIVEMVRPITKYAVLVESVEQLKRELPKAWAIATSGRRGPVLLDVPMDVQQAMMAPDLPEIAPEPPQGLSAEALAAELSQTLAHAQRPVVLWGGGVAMAGAADPLSDWLRSTRLPFVASWAGLSAFDHDHPGYLGQIGVYGNRGANFVLQNADAVIALGSRLDNRQRSGNADSFARGAVVHVVDIDPEELRKYGGGRTRGSLADLAALPAALPRIAPPRPDPSWLAYAAEMKAAYHGRESSTAARRLDTLSPYEVVRRIAALAAPDAIVAADTGAAVCWLHQAFPVKRHTLFTAGGNSPMGYALCAAIGAKLEAPGRQVIAWLGDGGFQLNIQELQTLVHQRLDIAIVVMNNGGYGIIRQFQDSNLGGRHIGSAEGTGAPDLGRVAQAYGLAYARIERLDQLGPDLFRRGPIVIDVILSPETQIEPKLEMGRPINDQSPPLDEAAYRDGNRYVEYPRPGSDG